MDALEEANIQVDNAEAAFIREREQLAITQNKSLSEVEQSKQTVKFLKMDLENYKFGQYPSRFTGRQKYDHTGGRRTQAC